jgi:hypothetical protein
MNISCSTCDIARFIELTDQLHLRTDRVIATCVTTQRLNGDYPRRKLLEDVTVLCDRRHGNITDKQVTDKHDDEEGGFLTKIP